MGRLGRVCLGWIGIALLVQCSAATLWGQDQSVHFPSCASRTHYTCGLKAPSEVLAEGRPTQIEAADGQRFSAAYFVRDGLFVNSVTDAAGQVSEEARDGRGYIVTRTDQLGTITRFSYDHRGNILSESRGDATWRMARDAAGRLLSQTDPNGAVQHFSYSSLGQMTATVDALGQRSETHYDSRGQVWMRTYADGTSEQTTYDSEDRRLSHVDAGGRITFDERDLLGRLVRTILADGSHSGKTRRSFNSGNGTIQPPIYRVVG